MDQTRFRCNGALYRKVKSDCKLRITICHGLWHEGAKVDTDLSVEDISFIQAKTTERFAPYQTRNLLSASSHMPVLWSKVHYRLCDFTRKTFMQNTNPFLSSLSLITACSKIELCFNRELPCVIALTTKLGSKSVKNHECAEVFLDSIYRKNSKFELSGVILWI